MFNFRDSNGTMRRQRDVALAATVAREGMLLVRTMEDGIEKVSPCSVAGSLLPVGFSVLDSENFTTDVVVEDVVVPSSGPYVVNLSNGNISGTGPASYLLSATVVGGSALVQNAGVAAGQFAVTDAAAGELTFNSAQAGDTVTVIARVTLSAEEAEQRGAGADNSDGGPGRRSVNNTASSFWRKVTIMAGHGQVYTKEYDTTIADWTAGPLVTGADGRVTIGGGGTSLAAYMRVIQVPSSEDAHLGIAFDIPV